MTTDDQRPLPSSDPGAGDYTLTNVRAVVDGELVERASVTVAGGTITAVDRGGPAPDGALDGAGLLVIPGLIDVHSDGLELEIQPRRTAELPIDYAIRSFEGRLRAAGITTVFHGLAYQERARSARTVERARTLNRAIAARRGDAASPVEHCVLYRFDANDEIALDPLLDDLAADRTVGADRPHISFEDHTPGQGQYRDVAQFAAAIDPEQTPGGVSVEEYVATLVSEGRERGPVRDRNLERLTPLARDGRIRLLAHDAATPDDLDRAADAGASIAEFPVTVEAATAAREREMTVVMGAPNALRGLSHSGNASARQLVRNGLCDVLASDYLPSSLLASAFTLARDGCCSLPAAIGLVTSGPARMAGLTDRGRLAEGCAADLVLVDDRGPFPAVVGVRRSADHPAWQVLG